MVPRGETATRQDATDTTDCSLSFFFLYSPIIRSPSKQSAVTYLPPPPSCLPLKTKQPS